MKKLIAAFLAVCIAATLFGCGGKREEIYTCTVSINCQTLLEEENYNKLKSEKREFVPEDGWILQPVEISFAEGDTAFDVLKKAVRENKIHMEFTETPAYKSVYIEGINNLYEFDCGKLSGWMFSVNGEFPNYGSSTYKLQDGDQVSWIYTCDLGADVGNEFE